MHERPLSVSREAEEDERTRRNRIYVSVLYDKKIAPTTLPEHGLVDNDKHRESAIEERHVEFGVAVITNNGAVEARICNKLV